MSGAGTDVRTMSELIDRHATTLASVGVPNPRGDALALAAAATGASAARLRTARVDEVEPQALARLETLVARRAARVPLQHLTGEVGFRHLVLRCEPGVFIARPETEVLAGLAVREAARAAARRGTAAVVEPCTGTGAIALSLVTEVAGVEVVATDRSPHAVALARRNLVEQQLAVGSTLTVEEGDLLASVPARLRGQVDVLVSNPPYLTREELAASEPEVRDHDPYDALVADHHPDAVIEELIAAAFGDDPWLRPGGVVLLEVSQHRIGAAIATARDAGAVGITTEPDLVGRERFLLARRPGDAAGHDTAAPGREGGA